MINSIKSSIAYNMSQNIKIHRIFSDKKLGHWFMFSAKRQMVEIRVTKSGLLRVWNPRKTTAPFDNGDNEP